MQAMTQMGYQEQIPLAALFPVQNEKKSNCTPHRPKARFHVRFYDFVEICRNDGGCADVLRYFEIQTDWLIDRLHRAHGMTEGYIPDPDDLWITPSYRDVSAGICFSQSHTTCGDRIDDLIALGFLERRFIARATSNIESRPSVTFYEDNRGIFIVVDDPDGNYIDSNGELRNAVEEGYSKPEWQYRYCINNVNIALAGAFLEPPEPAKRWPPLVKQWDPVSVEDNGASTPQDCSPKRAESAPDTNQLTDSRPRAQGGTSNAQVCEEGSGHLHSTVDTKPVSTIRANFGTNTPVFSANSQEVEEFHAAPWSTETLIGLARLRHTPGLFECHGDRDEDYDGAEALEKLRKKLDLDPRIFWPIVDQHIMAMMHGGIWWAKRQGSNLVFGLAQVARQWHRVEGNFVKHPYAVPDPIRYVGPPDKEGKPRDHSWILRTRQAPMPDEDGAPRDHSSIFDVLPPENDEKPPDHSSIIGHAEEPPPAPESSLEDEEPMIVEGSLEDPVPIEERQGSEGSPGMTEENAMYTIPPPQTWPPALRGMVAEEYNDLFDYVTEYYPMIIIGEPKQLTDGSWVMSIQWADNGWYSVRKIQEWLYDSQAQRAIGDAIRYGEAMQ